MQHNPGIPLLRALRLIDFDRFVQDSDLLAFAAIAYRRCCDWFGEPLDAATSYRVVQGPYCTMSYPMPPIAPWYTLALSSKAVTREQRFGHLAELMADRVLLAKRARAPSAWITAMLGFLVCQHLLDESGMAAYAQQLIEYYRELPHAKTLAEIARSRHRRTLLSSSFDLTVEAGIALAGTAVESIAGWQQTCKLAHAASWSAWLESLDAGMPESVERAIEIALRAD